MSGFVVNGNMIHELDKEDEYCPPIRRFIIMCMASLSGAIVPNELIFVLHPTKLIIYCSRLSEP